MPKIKVVVQLVRQLRHGFTKTAKVSPNFSVTHKVFSVVVYSGLPFSHNPPHAQFNQGNKPKCGRIVTASIRQLSTTQRVQSINQSINK